MKHILSFILIASIFSLLFCVAEPALASESDALIKILIKKGILTEEEAAEIKKEVKKDDEKRQEEIVKEIKEKDLVVPKALKGLKVGMLAYLDYSSGVRPLSGSDESYNEFRLTRGYLTVKKEILPWLHSRITIDTHQDDDEDWIMRIKYLYAELRPKDFGFLTNMKSEVGMGHIPWLDFEEHINLYRCQGTMAVERAGTFNSADIGVSIRGYLNGNLEDAEETTGSHYYDGRYGSWHFGVYNGSGYHDSEENNNKVIEGRFTLRPLPDIVPGLQLHYFGLHGQGNDNSSSPTNEWPDYDVNLGMLSYQHPWLTITGQYFETEGNAKGTWVDALGNALKTKGHSIFGRVKLPVLEKKLSLFARYDYFDQDYDGKIGSDADYDMYIGGVAYDIYKGNLIMLTYETTDYGSDAGEKGKLPVAGNNLGDDQKVQAVLQVKY